MIYLDDFSTPFLYRIVGKRKLYCKISNRCGIICTEAMSRAKFSKNNIRHALHVSICFFAGFDRAKARERERRRLSSGARRKRGDLRAKKYDAMVMDMIGRKYSIY